MNAIPPLKTSSFAAALFVACAAAAEPAALFDEATCYTVFAFDQTLVPHTQNLRVEMQAPERHPANPVVPRGAPGTPDSWAVQFYGSVIREGGKFRMWYV